MFLFAACIAVLCAGSLTAGEKTLMHCFAFTPIETASEADWQAFYKATDTLNEKLPTLKRVWYGKLRGNGLNQFQTDRETAKKLAAGEKNVSGTVNRSVRKHGVCMEFDNEEALKSYAGSPPHKEWMAAYEKVRVAGTTTYDILGQ
jgi:hypothetical protein